MAAYILMIQIILFDHNDHYLGSKDAYNRYYALLGKGYGIKEETYPAGAFSFLKYAWLEFDTEEAAAVFKLTYL